MAFEGDLTNLGLADIFQTLSMNRQSGTLVVKYGDTERRFYFTDDGVSLLTSRSARRFRLGNLLVGMGKLSEGDLRVAVLKQERAKDAKIGDILVQTGLVSAEDIAEACRYQAAEEIYDSFNWKSGKFQFLEGANAGPSGGPGPFAEFFFSVTDVVMEAARRADEHALTLQRIGDQDEFFRRSGDSRPDESTVGRPACALWDTLDGTASVRQVFEDFYLSPFDTAQAFVALLDHGCIRPMTPEELEAGMQPFLDRKDFPTAARMLRRAVHGRPRDADLLKRLADTEIAAGARREASVTLGRLGELHRSEGRSIEATEALRAAVEQDSRNEAAYELLMDVYVALEQMDRADEACREAARLLSDDRNFEGALRLLDRGLAAIPDSIALRIQRGNALLALGRRDEGVAEMSTAATALEARGDQGQLLLGVYRKLLQLEPDRKDLKDRIDAIVAGEKARAQRQKLLRIGGAVAAVVASIVIWMLIPPSAAKRLVMAAAILDGKSDGSLDQAEAWVANVLRSAEDGSENHMTAQTLMQRIVARKDAPLRAKRVAEFKAAIQKEYTDPAAALAERLLFADAVARAIEAYRRVKGPESEALRGVKEFEDLLKWTQEQVRGVVRAAKSALQAELATVQATMTNVEGVKLDRATEAQRRQVYDVTTKTLAQRSRVDWAATLDALALAETSVGATEGVRVQDLRNVVDDLSRYYATIDTTHQQARAMVMAMALDDGFSSTLGEVARAKGRGDLDAAVRACEEYLNRCREFREGEPREFFAPLVADVLEASGREKRIADTLAALRSTQGGIRTAGELRKQGRLQEAFDLLRKTLLAATDVDLRVSVELPVRITSTPPGATVIVTRPDVAPIRAGTANPSIDLTYPYTGRTEIRLELDGFEPAVVRLDGLPGDTRALVDVHLQRRMRWQKEVGAAVEGAPAVVGGRVVVASRAGILRVLSADRGDEVFQLDTGHASGVRGGVVTDGSRAYLAGADGEGFAVDLAGQRFAWRTRLAAPVSTTPVLLGDLVAFADERGGLTALRRADGAQAWTLTLGAPATGRPVLIDALVVVGLADGHLVAVGADGRERWRSMLSGPIFAPAAPDGDGGIVVATDAGTIERAAVADGKVRWKTDLGGNAHAPAVVRGGVVRVMTTGGTVVRIGLADGRIQGTTALGKAADGAAVESGSLMFLGSTDGSLVAYDIEKDAARWVYAAGGPVLAPPAVGPSHLIVVLADATGRVIALEP